MNPASDTWTRTVDSRTNRKQALRDALAELPRGVVWDLVIRHDPDCLTLAGLDGYSELEFCTCGTLILEATRIR